jgi:hypothetical protein
MPGHASIRQYLSRIVPKKELDPDDAKDFLNKILEMKEKVEKESNWFFAIALITTILYLLKLFGASFKLKILGTEFISVADPLFVLGAISLSAFTVAAMRAADSAFYERIIDSLCAELWPAAPKFASLAHYGGGGLHHNIMDIPTGEIAGRYDRTLLRASTYGVGSVITLFAIGPMLVGGTFLYQALFSGGTAQLAKSALIVVLLASALIEGLLALRFLGEDE